MWEQLLEGRARTSSSGVCHTHDALCSNQPQYFGDGTRLSVLGKLQNQGGRAIVPWRRSSLLLLPALVRRIE